MAQNKNATLQVIVLVSDDDILLYFGGLSGTFFGSAISAALTSKAHAILRQPYTLQGQTQNSMVKY